MVGEGRPEDKRLFPRAAVVGSALVVAEKRYVGTYVLANLSAGGALLKGDTRLAIGDHVRLVLQLHDRGLYLEAAVVRHATAEGQGAFALRFLHLSPAAQDAIQEAVFRELRSKGATPIVLVVDSTPEQAMITSALVQELGSNAVSVRSALDAVTWLMGSRAHVQAAIVDAELDRVDGLSVLQFMAADFPAVRRVLAYRGDEAIYELAVGAGQVHALFRKPGDVASLARALGEPPGGPLAG